MRLINCRVQRSKREKNYHCHDPTFTILDRRFSLVLFAPGARPRNGNSSSPSLVQRSACSNHHLPPPNLPPPSNQRRKLNPRPSRSPQTLVQLPSPLAHPTLQHRRLPRSQHPLHPHRLRPLQTPPLRIPRPGLSLHIPLTPHANPPPLHYRLLHHRHRHALVVSGSTSLAAVTGGSRGYCEKRGVDL